MVSRFYVPKFITIEDRLAGLFTFRQLFALLGAFFLTFFSFKANQLLGLIVGFLSFGSAFLFTFVQVNGKPFIYIFPDVLDFLFRSRKYVWQKVEKFTYKEIEIPEIGEVETEAPIELPEIKPREKKKITPSKTSIELTYPQVAPQYKERIIISLEEPIVNQVEEINKIVHRHLANPYNPYRLFPYIKFYRSFKKAND